MARNFTDGRYRLQVTNQNFTVSSNQRPQFALECDILGQYIEGEVVACETGKATIYCDLTNKDGAWMHDVFVQQINMVFETKLASAENLHPECKTDACNLVGQEFDAVLSHYTSNKDGKEKERWDFANRVGRGVQQNAMALSDLQQLMRLHGAGKTKPTTRKPAATGKNNDIPF